jgi:hypothetical protein
MGTATKNMTRINSMYCPPILTCIELINSIKRVFIQYLKFIINPTS